MERAFIPSVMVEINSVVEKTPLHVSIGRTWLTVANVRRLTAIPNEARRAAVSAEIAAAKNSRMISEGPHFSGIFRLPVPLNLDSATLQSEQATKKWRSNQ